MLWGELILDTNFLLQKLIIQFTFSLDLKIFLTYLLVISENFSYYQQQLSFTLAFKADEYYGKHQFKTATNFT